MLRSRCLLGPVSALVLACVCSCSPDDPLAFGNPSSSASGSSGAQACTPGAQVACACLGGGEGVQICTPDGLGLGPCDCSGAGGAAGSSGIGAGGAAGSGGSSSSGNSAGGAAGAGGNGAGGMGGTGGAMACTPGSTMPCYSGPAGTEGIGLCTAGVATCDTLGAGYGPCTGEVLPQPEVCATAGDDDCDGLVNEDGVDCACAPGSTAPCYSGPMSTRGVGPCHGGTQTCAMDGTGYGLCAGEVLPQAETCTTPEDDDCDGTVNEEGVGCVCVPGSTVPCYSGPPGTENVGLCKGGLATCNAMGTGYGACAGEVVPQPEKCATPQDEDCDGATPTCLTGPHVWSKAFGGPQTQSVAGIAFDGSGNIVVAGVLLGSADFGGGPLVSAGSNDVFVVKLDANGNHLWSKRYGSSGVDSAFGVAVAPNGEIVVTGDFEATVDFGGGPLTSPSQSSVFALKLDPSGNHVWSKTFGGGTINDIARAVAIDGAGNIVLAASLGGTLSFGGTPLVCAGSADVAIAKLTAAGNHIWSQRFGDSDYQHPFGLGLDATGNVLLTGYLTGTINFGGGALTSAGAADVFVAKLDPAGAHVYSKRFGDASNQAPQSLAVDGAGNMIVAGYAAGTLDLGGGPLAPKGSQDIFAGKLDPSGAHVWSKRFGSAGSTMNVADIAADGAGSLVITGTSFGPLDLGGGPLPGTSTMFVGKLDASGAHVWSKSFGNSAPPTPQSVAAESGGGSVIGGSFSATIDFGGGPLDSLGGNDIFVLKLGP